MKRDLGALIDGMDLPLTTEEIAEITGCSKRRIPDLLLPRLESLQAQGRILLVDDRWRRTTDQRGIRGFLREQEAPVTSWQVARAFGWGTDMARAVLEYLLDFKYAVQADHDDLWVGA